MLENDRLLKPFQKLPDIPTDMLHIGKCQIKPKWIIGISGLEVLNSHFPSLIDFEDIQNKQKTIFNEQQMVNSNSMNKKNRENFANDTTLT